VLFQVRCILIRKLTAIPSPATLGTNLQVKPNMNLPAINSSVTVVRLRTKRRMDHSSSGGARVGRGDAAMSDEVLVDFAIARPEAHTKRGAPSTMTAKLVCSGGGGNAHTIQYSLTW
jgi:hypothetical protein